MEEIRASGLHPKECGACDIAFNQCPISCFQEHGKFGITPHHVHCVYERAKVEVIQEWVHDYSLKDLKVEDASIYKGV